MSSRLRRRSLTVALLAGVVSLAGPMSASAAIEIKATSKYVAWPGWATVKVRSTTGAESITFVQERPDVRRLLPGGQTAGWDCTSPIPSSKLGYLPGYKVVARAQTTVAGEWVTVPIRATSLEFAYFPSLQEQWLLATQGPDYRAGYCLDKGSQYTRLSAWTPQGDYAGIALTRVL